MAILRYPRDAREQPAYWVMPGNLWAARRKLFRRDRSNEWRYSFKGGDSSVGPDRSVSYSRLLDGRSTDGFRFLVLGDTGEGDRSQYSTLPLIRGLKPDFMIINGDVAYPAGRDRDFQRGCLQPYRGLDIPIWAVPGNHEYYSRHHGEEFFQLFCCESSRRLWSEYGLRFEPQPGTYWELGERDVHLVVLGVDSGKTGNLDGNARGEGEDRRQHEWLRWRLDKAEVEEKSALVLFHIPALVRERHIKKTHLTRLHQIIARSQAVRLVICAHEHNSQLYDADVFRKYLKDWHLDSYRPDHPGDRPEYWVSGGGGAYLNATDFEHGEYKAKERYPSSKQWREYARLAKRIVEKSSSIARSPLGRAISVVDKAAVRDADIGRYLSFVIVDVGLEKIEATPVFMDDVDELYSTLPKDAVVRVDDPDPSVEENAVKCTVRSEKAAQIWP